MKIIPAKACVATAFGVARNMSKRFLCLLLVLISPLGFAHAQPRREPGANRTQPGQPPDGPRNFRPPTQGPYTHKVQSASSADGLAWKLDEGVLLEHASVPASVALPDGRIRIYYVDASHAPENANVAESTDGGKTFTPLGLVITNRAKSKALDPAIVRLPDGRWRLYYFACGQNPSEDGAHEIHAAISTDGVHFTEEQKVFTREGLVDPDVFWNGKEWLMFVFSHQDGETIVARSQDGLSFAYSGPLGLKGWGTTAPMKLDDGRFRLYAFRQRGMNSVGSFTSSDGLKWIQESGERLAAPEGKEITDPFVLRLKDGTWKMFFKISEAQPRGEFADQPRGPGQFHGEPGGPFRPQRGGNPEFNGPWNHDLVLLESSDGANFTNRQVFVERAGVPCILRESKGRLSAVFQWFPFDRREAFDKVAVVFSSDEGNTWTKPELVVVKDLPEDYQRPFDPTLVQLDDGRFRLYFTSHSPTNRTPAIYSAIGADAIHFSFEPGARLADEGKKVVDCSVAKLGETWHMFAPVEGPSSSEGYHAVSEDGLSFKRLTNVRVDNRRSSWIGNVLTVGKELRFFGSGGDGGWTAKSSDGSTWELISTALHAGGDPSAVKLPSGRTLVVATGESRRDASASPFSKNKSDGFSTSAPFASAAKMRRLGCENLGLGEMA